MCESFHFENFIFQLFRWFQYWYSSLLPKWKINKKIDWPKKNVAIDVAKLFRPFFLRKRWKKKLKKSVTILWIEQRKIDLKTIFECTLYRRFIFTIDLQIDDEMLIEILWEKKKHYIIPMVLIPWIGSCVHLCCRFSLLEINEYPFQELIVWIWSFHFTRQKWMDEILNLKLNVFFFQTDWPNGMNYVPILLIISLWIMRIRNVSSTFFTLGAFFLSLLHSCAYISIHISFLHMVSISFWSFSRKQIGYCWIVFMCEAVYYRNR